MQSLEALLFCVMYLIDVQCCSAIVNAINSFIQYLIFFKVSEEETKIEREREKEREKERERERRHKERETEKKRVGLL